MLVFRNSFRKWWQPPRKVGEGPEERSVTFLELFYDLVYVVIIAELAHALATDVTLSGVGRFVFLFVIIWWAWLNGATYHDTHGNNDMRTRIFTFLQMSTVAAMAVFAGDALGEGSVGFALSYSAFQLILTYLWWRTGVHDPDHRPLSQPYSAAFLLTTLLFAGSVFVPAPARFYLWLIALLLSLLLPVNLFRSGRNDPAVQEQIDQITNISPSFVERFGLFTIIVLGEVLVGTISGLASHHDLSWTVGLTSGLGMLIAIGLWWVYFDFVSQRRPQPTGAKVTQWIYLHLPMTMGIAATGAAVLNIIEHAGEPLPADVQWLLLGAVSMALICIALLLRTILIPQDQVQIYLRGSLIGLASALLVLLLGILNLPAIPLLMVLVLVMLWPIVYGIKVWIVVFGAEDVPIL